MLHESNARVNLKSLKKHHNFPPDLPIEKPLHSYNQTKHQSLKVTDGAFDDGKRLGDKRRGYVDARA